MISHHLCNHGKGTAFQAGNIAARIPSAAGDIRAGNGLAENKICSFKMNMAHE